MEALGWFSYKAGEPNNSANLQAFRRWDYGGIVGMKAVIADHYTISFDYRVGIKRYRHKMVCGIQLSSSLWAIVSKLI